MDPDTGLGMLDNALRIRERAGLRIEQIFIFGCSVSERAISQLKTNGHYKRLLWDGKLNGVNERQQLAYLKARESVFGSSFGSPRVLHEI
ncbi:hypothetical protein PENSPDRAFT_646177 [Peniophora sp. CONT]|nr:hypothetical protein PENSPDRAFT_646177 [Peniophora sp. CONT]